MFISYLIEKYVEGRKNVALCWQSFPKATTLSQWKGRYPAELRAGWVEFLAELSELSRSKGRNWARSFCSWATDGCLCSPIKKAALWRAGQEKHPVQYENPTALQNEWPFYSQGIQNKTCSCAARNSTVQQQGTQDNSGHCSTPALIPSNWGLSHVDLPSK